MEGRVTVHHDVPADILKDLENRYHLLDKQRWKGGKDKEQKQREGVGEMEQTEERKRRRREKEQKDTEKSHCVD